MKFINWYYTKGISQLLVIWKNFFKFFWRFFSINTLFSHLLSPWKKETFHSEEPGWHPLLRLQLFATNNFFRVFGAFIKLIFIFFGLGFEILVALFGIITFLFWIAFPFISLIALALLFFMPKIALLVWLIIILFSAFVLSTYHYCQKIDILTLSIEELYDEEIFGRILRRINSNKKEFPKELLFNHEQLEKLLKNNGLAFSEFEEIIKWEIFRMIKKQEQKTFWSERFLDNIPAIGAQWIYGYTNNLDRFSSDLSVSDFSQYQKIELFGYDEELSLLKMALAGRNQNSAILIGDAGIGKKSIIHYLAKKIRTGEMPGVFANQRILQINPGEIISGAASAGKNPESFLHLIFSEAANAGNVIIFIDNIDLYLEEGGMVNFGAVLQEYLPYPAFQVIATVTKKSFHQKMERHENILKNFETIEIKEPKEIECTRILLQQMEDEEQSKVIFTYPAIKKIIFRSDQLGKITPLPERAIDLAAQTLIFWKKNGGYELITPQTVDEFIAAKTGIAQGKIEEEEKEKLLDLENILHQRVIGQNGAIEQIADTVRKMRAGIKNEKKPAGSFLFLGSTGVGKTETAKALAHAYFGDEKRMIRFDMSEYQKPDSIDRLIGSQQTGTPGLLVSQVRDNPFSLILLDELEKAYKEILNLFLQVLDEGYLTDAFGDRVNFRSCIIIATSNAGAELIRKSVIEKKAAENLRKELTDYIINQGIFRPEFINRFDDVIFFQPLNQEETRQVIELMLRKLAQRIEQNKNIKLQFESTVVDKILENGYDPTFGARSINRYIADRIEDELAKKIIAQEVGNGESLLIKAQDLL